MKTKIININGKQGKEISLPKCFSQPVREDIIVRVIEVKKNIQPYAPSLVGGKQHSASGKIVHRRHVWKSGYGRGQSRIPRKQMSRKGSQFNWVGAEVPNTRGGRRAHPPKVLSMINTKKINKKELKIALVSAISATTKADLISKRYSRLTGSKALDVGRNATGSTPAFPLVAESKLTTLKTKELLDSLKKILGEDLSKVALKKKTVRSGKGKLRGRKYKSNAGLLLVTGDKEKLKTNAFDVVNINNLSVNDLAKGGVIGRLTIYTEEAVKELENKFKEKME